MPWSKASLCGCNVHIYVVNLLGGAVSITVRLSLRLNIPLNVSQILLYSEHVKSRWHSSSAKLSLHNRELFSDRLSYRALLISILIDFINC